MLAISRIEELNRRSSYPRALILSILAARLRVPSIENDTSSSTLSILS